MAVVVVVSLPFVALFAHSQVIVPIGLMALLGAWAGFRDRELLPLICPRVGPPGWVLATLVGLFIVWAFVGLAWTPSLEAGFRAAWTFAVIALATPTCALFFFALARKGALPLAIDALAIALAITSALVVIELSSGGIILSYLSVASAPVVGRESVFNTGVLVTFLLGWPVVWNLWKRGRRVGAAGLVTLIVLALFLSKSDATKVALFIGIVGGLGTLALGPWMARLVVWGYGAVVLAMPMVVGRLLTDAVFQKVAPNLPFSLQHRLVIWRATGDLVAEHPLVGWGIAASRSFSRNRLVHDFFMGKRGWVEETVQVMPIHPHNAALQVWLDLGAIGAVLTVALLVVLGEYKARTTMSRGPRALATGMVASGLALTLGTYSVWQGWLLSIAVALLCLSWVVFGARTSTENGSGQ
jgi:O-antigen ligase